MKNGIVILNYNDSENTILMLEDIKKFKNLDAIIVVDNHSTDNSVQKLKAYENKKIKIVVADENRGYGAGNNIGINYLLKNYEIDNIIISNTDIIVKEEVPETVEEVVDTVSEEPTEEVKETPVAEETPVKEEKSLEDGNYQLFNQK